ncbi:MAG TPA: peptidoglycan DD-metalloendopeptidase family protein [Wenzhouxiangellaceae bacterium]|nr:peptidoglycan DD-metalloendopeptidase family protein [Wenzhouxiangellaceae bacterium]
MCGLAVVALAFALLTGCGAPGPLMPDQRASSSAESRPPPAPESYRVRSGDTLYSIAFGYGLDWRRVARWNDISAPYTILVGDWIRLQAPPDMRPAVLTADTPASTPKPASRRISEPVDGDKADITGSSRPQQAKTSSSSAGKASAEPEPRPATTAARQPPEIGQDPAGDTASTPVPAAATRSVAGMAWRWPTEGGIARGFNTGASRKGILISGEGGQPIRAAADGEVVYSGNGLIGYGELIIIKHSDRMLSAYAHNRERLVGEGQQVRSGQLIARMGSDEREQFVLHFEIRRDGKPDDPVRYLPPR